MLLQGLMDEGVLQDPNDPDSARPAEQPPGTPGGVHGKPTTYDLSGETPPIQGFKTRRVG